MKTLILLSIAALLLLSCTNASATAEGVGNEGLECAVKKILSAIQVRKADSLYDAQTSLILPLRASFDLGLDGVTSVFLEGLAHALDQTASLGHLRSKARSGSIRLDPFLWNPSRSGGDDRHFFPVEEKFANRIFPAVEAFEQPVITEARLSQLQFCYLLSSAMKQVAHRGECQHLSQVEARFLSRTFSFLLRSIAVPYWVDVEVGGWHRRFPNLKARISTFLNPSSYDVTLWKSYCRAITDTDLFVVAIAADLLHVADAFNNALGIEKIQPQEREVLLEIRDSALQIMEQGIQPGKGFLFQVGIWADYPDFLYAGCRGNELPVRPCPKKDVAEDSSHFHRWPWWLESFRDSWPSDHANHRYYEGLLRRLAEQFVSKVVASRGNGLILLSNYMDGTNGWYRVGYRGRSWGNGPYTLSLTALYGSWYILGKYDSRIKGIRNSLCTMVRSTDPETIQFRIKYYGGRSSTNPYPNGWGDKDILGADSIYNLYCEMAERLFPD